MITLSHDAALVASAAGLAVAALVLAANQQIRCSIPILLDFFTAAGLLRLVGQASWSRLAAVAVTIVVREVASPGLRVTQAPPA